MRGTGTSLGLAADWAPLPGVNWTTDSSRNRHGWITNREPLADVARTGLGRASDRGTGTSVSRVADWGPRAGAGWSADKGDTGRCQPGSQQRDTGRCQPGSR